MHATTASQETSSPLKKQIRPITNTLKQSHLPEPVSPLTCRKKVVGVPKTNIISNTKKEPAFKGRTSSDDFLSLTPLKGGSTGNSNSCTFPSSIKTIKKGNSFKEGDFLPPTANKNRHASKFGCQSQQPTSGVKQVRVPLYGKRKATELENKENERKAGGERSLSWRDKQENSKVIKKLKTTIPEAKKKEIKHEKIYFSDSTKTKMFCFSVFFEKDLGYNQFVQTTTKETDVDNDCLTDSDIMENVRHWTLEDLKEGIEMHKEEDKQVEKTDESGTHATQSEYSEVDTIEHSETSSEVRVERGFCNGL